MHLDGSDNDSDDISDGREIIISGYSYCFHIN